MPKPFLCWWNLLFELIFVCSKPLTLVGSILTFRASELSRNQLTKYEVPWSKVPIRCWFLIPISCWFDGFSGDFRWFESVESSWISLKPWFFPANPKIFSNSTSSKTPVETVGFLNPSRLVHQVVVSCLWRRSGLRRRLPSLLRAKTHMSITTNHWEIWGFKLFRAEFDNSRLWKWRASDIRRVYFRLALREEAEQFRACIERLGQKLEMPLSAGRGLT